MATRAVVDVGRGSRLSWTHLAATVGVLVSAVAVAAAFAWSNSRYAEWIVALVGAESRLGQGLLFSALPLALAVGITARRPRLFGVQLGETVSRWRHVVGTTVALCAVVAVALTRLPSNPFSGADVVIQVIAVPVSEELLFRGVLFTAVLWALDRFLQGRRATAVAVVISGVAFGVAHLNNLAIYDPVFVLLQTVNATVLGISAGHLRAVTHSVLPAIVLHAAVNAVALV